MSEFASLWTNMYNLQNKNRFLNIVVHKLRTGKIVLFRNPQQPIFVYISLQEIFFQSSQRNASLNCTVTPIRWSFSDQPRAAPVLATRRTGEVAKFWKFLEKHTIFPEHSVSKQSNAIYVTSLWILCVGKQSSYKIKWLWCIVHILQYAMRERERERKKERGS